MKIEPLEVYATDCNYAVIKAPGRNFPGCVVQGDSLSILCRKVKDIVSFAVANQIVDRDFLIDVQELNNSLVDRLLHYQQSKFLMNTELVYRTDVLSVKMIL